MAFPFGGIPLENLRAVLTDAFGVEEHTTSEDVDTLDGPQRQPFWVNHENKKSVETPVDHGRAISVERLGNIVRRLDLDFADVLNALLKLEAENQ